MIIWIGWGLGHGRGPDGKLMGSVEAATRQDGGRARKRERRKSFDDVRQPAGSVIGHMPPGHLPRVRVMIYG